MSQNQTEIKMAKKEKLKLMLIELAKSGNLDLNQFPESIRQKISQIRQNEGMIFTPGHWISVRLGSVRLGSVCGRSDIP